MKKTGIVRAILACMIFGHAPFVLSLDQYGNYEKSEYSDTRQLVSWNTREGKKRLLNAKYSEDFYQLAHHYQPQANPLYCGIASSVMVLNALRIAKNTIPSQSGLEVQKPKVWGGDKLPYKLYSQATFLNAKTDKVKPKNIIELTNITKSNQLDSSQFDPGLTLSQLKEILEVYDVKVQLNYAQGRGKNGINKFRKHLKQILGETEKFVLINYKSDKVGQAGGGHISPLGAYDAASDSVLVLDVSGHLNPWLWIPVRDLYLSMHTKDGKNYRGYLIVEDDL
ncbi:MAG: phytochelatin synthase family protein [Gammaproteobacteria bacterium]|nr:phytochelatin synthase family protein [Gammaproteobacteria bacterium]